MTNGIPWQRFELLRSLYLLLCAAYRTRFATSTISTLFDDQHSVRWSPRADRSIGRLVHMIRRMSNHLISTDRSAYNMWGADRCRCHMSERDHPFLFLAPDFPFKERKGCLSLTSLSCSKCTAVDSLSFSFVSYSLCNTLPLSQWRGTNSFPSR